MNSSSIDRNQKNKLINNQIKKKQAPISLITCSQAIFVKNKIGNIASSYIDGSQKIQNAEKAKKIMMNNTNQPIICSQNKNAHMKNQTNILKTIQTSILANHIMGQQRTSHSIVNSFTSNPVFLHGKDNVPKDQSVKLRLNTNNAYVNLTKQSINESKQTYTNAAMKLSFNSKKNNNDVKNSFVNNNDKGKQIKSKLSLQRHTIKKALNMINSRQSKQQQNTTEIVSISLRENEKVLHTQNCINSFINGHYVNNSIMPLKTEDSYIATQTMQSNDICNTYSNIETEKCNGENDINKKQNEPKEKIRKNTKVFELKIQLNKEKNLPISINLANNNSINNNTNMTEGNIIAPKINLNDTKEKDKIIKARPINTNNNSGIKKEKKRAPRCPIKLNLLSLIQENKIKLRKEKVINSSKCSFEDIDTILKTDVNIDDSRCYMDFDNFDDMNSIIRRIHFEKINKKTMNIFSEDSDVYTDYQQKFNDKFNNNKCPKYNSEQRTNASGSTCENSSKKTFIPMTKLTPKIPHE